MTEQGERKKPLVEWTEEERALIAPLMAAMRTKTRSTVEQTTKQFAIEQYGIAADDLNQLPSFPRWITDSALRDEEEFVHEFENTLVVLLPKRALIRKKPTSEILIKCRPGNKSIWFKFEYNLDGITTGVELVDFYEGLPFEEQDPSSRPDLN